MAPNNSHGRRKFLKRLATATAVTGGVLGATTSASAVSQTLEVDRFSGSTGSVDYTIELDNGDKVLSGSLAESEMDSYSLTSRQITSVEFQNSWQYDVDVRLSNPLAYNGDRELRVYSQYDYEDYLIYTNSGSISRKKLTESGDTIDGTSVNGSVDESSGDQNDYFTTSNGSIDYISVGTTSAGGHVHFLHPY